MELNEDVAAIIARDFEFDDQGTDFWNYDRYADPDASSTIIDVHRRHTGVKVAAPSEIPFSGPDPSSDGVNAAAYADLWWEDGFSEDYASGDPLPETPLPKDVDENYFSQEVDDRIYYSKAPTPAVAVNSPASNISFDPAEFANIQTGSEGNVENSNFEVEYSPALAEAFQDSLLTMDALFSDVTVPALDGFSAVLEETGIADNVPEAPTHYIPSSLAVQDDNSVNIDEIKTNKRRKSIREPEKRVRLNNSVSGESSSGSASQAKWGAVETCTMPNIQSDGQANADHQSLQRLFDYYFGSSTVQTPIDELGSNRMSTQQVAPQCESNHSLSSEHDSTRSDSPTDVFDNSMTSTTSTSSPAPSDSPVRQYARPRADFVNTQAYLQYLLSEIDGQRGKPTSRLSEETEEEYIARLKLRVEMKFNQRNCRAGLSRPHRRKRLTKVQKEANVAAAALMASNQADTGSETVSLAPDTSVDGSLTQGDHEAENVDPIPGPIDFSNGYGIDIFSGNMMSDTEFQAMMNSFVAGTDAASVATGTQNDSPAMDGEEAELIE